MDIEKPKYGPAMQKLNERQRLFVLNLMEFGDDNFTRAARAAGYTDTGDPKTTAIRLQAHKLAHDPRIQEAMLEEAKRRLQGGLILAVSTLVTHVRSADPKVALKAAEMLMNRGGIHALSEHKVNVEHTLNEEEMVKSIEMMAQKMGIDPSSLLGDAGVKQLPPPRQVPIDVIDAEFEEVGINLEGLDDVL